MLNYFAYKLSFDMGSEQNTSIEFSKMKGDVVNFQSQNALYLLVNNFHFENIIFQSIKEAVENGNDDVENEKFIFFGFLVMKFSGKTSKKFFSRCISIG